MPRIYKGTTAKLALMYYPCVINPSDVSELTIAIYSEGTNEAIEYSLANMTLKDNIAFINLAKYQLDVLDNGVIKYVARGVYKGNEFVQDRYSNYYIQTPKDYVIEDIAVQDIKRVDISELITNVLPDSGYDGMGEVIVDANPLINNVADNAVALDVDKNGTYVAELADNYKGYIKEINVSVPSVNVEQLTQEEYDNITPAKDILYLISDAIPEHNLKTINGETLVGEGDIVIESGTDIPYLVIDNLSILDGDFDAVYDAINNKQPYYIYKKRNSGELIDAECAAIRDNYIDVIFCIETYFDNELHFYYTTSEIYSDRVNCIKDEIIDIPTQFKTINGNDILGEGDITIEANVDLTGYATEQWVEEQEYAPLSDVNYLAMMVSGKQPTITDLDEIRTGAELGKTAIQEIPSEYITETELNDALANVGGGNGNIVELTQEEYNNITPDEETLYLISDVAPKENLKTINGESIIGTGDIVIEANVDLTGYATEQWVDDKGYLKEIPEEYVTEDELNEAIANIDSGNNIVSSTIFLEAIGDFENKKILSDKVGYEEHNRAVYDRLYNIVKQENPSFSDETFIVNAEFNMNGLTTRMNGILSYSGDIIFSTFSIFMNTNINYSLWSDVELFIQNYINNEPMEFVIDVAHIDYHNIATTKYVDEQLGNVNNILENIIG